ncbi:response regulator transcription factor [Massilia sp. TS11]|uniref:response regulator transcription factor n=1 Tax=Massilia sp. TS11 TaxID=2908003 RepID=UPI001EDAA408|nr:response regulator [Massilia sp. TS11]MCG2585539.1 response regulator [Massilia sp. TS11]
MKALVVDDDVVSRMALMDLLQSFDSFELLEAEDGEAAWQMMEEGLRPVICFCDVRMPRMSGIELLQRLKSHPTLAEVPFVLVSSASDRDTVLQAVKLGAVGYILKPLKAIDARAHLEKIFKITLDKLTEAPSATLKRLNISPARLASYLKAFQGQLASGAEDIADLISAYDDEGARARLDALHTGCMTLGLWHVATLLDSQRKGSELDAERIGAVIAEVAAAAERQHQRVKNSMAASGAGG